VVALQARPRPEDETGGIDQQGARHAAVGFRGGKGSDPAGTFGDRAQEPLDFFIGTHVEEHGERDVVHVPGGGESRIAGRHFLEDHDGAHRIQTHPAEFRRNDHLMKALLEPLAVYIHRNGVFRIRPAVVLQHDRLELALDERAHHVAIHPLRLVEFEVHENLLSPASPTPPGAAALRSAPAAPTA